MVKLYKRDWIWQYLPKDEPEKKEDYYIVNEKENYYRVLSCEEENLRGREELEGFDPIHPEEDETIKEISLKEIPKKYRKRITEDEYSQLEYI